jgi:hypothetical protein
MQYTSQVEHVRQAPRSRGLRGTPSVLHCLVIDIESRGGRELTDERRIRIWAFSDGEPRQLHSLALRRSSDDGGKVRFCMRVGSISDEGIDLC